MLVLKTFLGILLAGVAFVSAESLLLLTITGEVGKSEDMATINHLYREAVENRFKGAVLPDTSRTEPCGARDCAIASAQKRQADQVIYSTFSPLGSKWVFSSTIVKSDRSDAFNQRLNALTIEDMGAVTQRMADALLNRIQLNPISTVQENPSLPKEEAEVNYGLIGNLSNGRKGTAAGYHQHDGFFLSMNYGGGGGVTRWDRSNNSGSGTATISSSGFMMDLKIGGAIKKNLQMSGDMMINVNEDPNVSGTGLDVNGLGVQSRDSVDGPAVVGLGLGVTYYFMPQNVFLSGTLGAGRLAVKDKYGLEGDSSARYSRANGYYLQFKAGKEWWVSKNWGLGVSAIYSFFQGNEITDVPKDPSYVIDPSYKGSFNSQHFGVMFNTTFN